MVSMPCKMVLNYFRGWLTHHHSLKIYIIPTMSELSLILLCLVVLVSCIHNAESYSLLTSNVKRTTVHSLTMKGKGNRVPIDQRGEYMKQQRMMEVKAKMEKEKPTGVPIFKIFVRPKAGGLWIPCGDLAGDPRATALVNAWLSGFMEDMYKSQLDKGVAKSIFTQEDAFIKGLIENYKPFKKFTKDDLQFGYKVDFEGVEEKKGEQKILVLEKGMEKGWLDNVKESIGSFFKNSEDE